MTRHFDVSSSDGITHAVLSQPERQNRLKIDAFAELQSIIERADATGATRAMVLTSTGQHFSAGLDHADLAAELTTTDGNSGRGRDQARLLHRSRDIQNSVRAIERARFPVIVGVQGGCVGGAFEIVAACDLRLAANDAFFRLPEIDLACAPDIGSLVRLPALIPRGLVAELAYTGRPLVAEEALAHGFVCRIVDDRAAVVEAAVSLAETIAEKSPLAIWGTKHLLQEAADAVIDRALGYTALWQTALLDREEVVEAIAARVAKRAPAFQDLPPLPNSA